MGQLVMASSCCPKIPAKHSKERLQQRGKMLLALAAAESLDLWTESLAGHELTRIRTRMIGATARSA